MSFDVTSLFTNVALDLIINIILRQIYNLNEVNTNIPKQEMKNEKSYFIVHQKMYILVIIMKSINKHVVPMVSTFGPVMAGIFMVDLEITVLPTFNEHMTPWERYVDGIIYYIKEESIELILSKLNIYHNNIKYIIIFLISCKDSGVEKTVHRTNKYNL